MDQVREKPTSHVLETPVWMVVVRGFQFLISLVVLGLAGRLMHDLYLDEFGLSVATAILTWCILFYAIATEKIPPWQTAYHVLAVMVLDGFLVVMWLATFAAVAARRATFNVDVRVNGCVDNGSAIGSKTCFTKRQLERRDILFKSGSAMMSAIAGLGALLWLLFIATFVWTAVMFIRGRKEGRFPISGGSGASGASNAFQMEPKTDQGAPMMQQQQQQQFVQPQHTGEFQPSPLSQNPTPAPYQQQQQQQPYPPPHDSQHYAPYNQQYPLHQQHVQQGGELSGTPLPQQAYSPPPVTTSPPPQQQPYYHQPQPQPQQYQQ